MDVTEGAVDKGADAGSSEGAKRRFKKIDLVVVTEAFGMNKEMLKAGELLFLLCFTQLYSTLLYSTPLYSTVLFSPLL